MKQNRILPRKMKTRSLNHLGLILGMCDQLHLVEMIDQALGSSNAHNKVLSHGEVVKLMLLNGLGFVSNTLYLYPQFFKGKPLHMITKNCVHESQINDDLLGRTLDALFESGVSRIFESVAKEVIHQLGIEVRSLHMDTTSFHVDGSYRGKEGEQHVQLKHGYSRDGHPELKQVVLQLITTVEGKLPLFMKPLNGNQSDPPSFAKSVRVHIDSVRQALENPYVVGDAALCTSESIQLLHKRHIPFVTRVPATISLAKQLLQETSSDQMQEIGEGYSACEHVVTHHGCPQRWIVIHSEQAQKRNEEKGAYRWKKLCQKFESSFRRLKKKSFCCREDAAKSLEEYAQQHAYIDLSTTSIGEVKKYKKAGRPTDKTPYKSTYAIQGECVIQDGAYETWMHHQGHFIIATNDLDCDAFPACDVLKMYKEQQSVEGGFRFLKSPEFFTSSFFVKNPERIEALLMVMTLCLLVYGALEHQIRQGLQKQRLDFIDQKNRATRTPTAKWVFFCFREIHVICKGDWYMVTNVDQEHLTILQVLGARYQDLYAEGWRRMPREVTIH